MARGFVQSVLRWPILLVVTVIMTCEALCYLLLRLGVKAYEASSNALRSNRALRKRMHTASTFNAWSEAARELDRLEGRDRWKRDPASPFYDHTLIEETVTALRAHTASGDVRRLMEQCHFVFSKHNLGGTANNELYSQTHFGTKLLVHDLHQSLTEALVVVRDHPTLPLGEKVQFFRKAQRAYGRTALLLSGGAAMGYFHVGVLKALFESKCLPQVICGASAGSLIASYVCTHTDAELVANQFFHPSIHRIFTGCEEPLFTVRLRRYLTRGYMFDVKQWIDKLQVVTRGNTTFLEAYKRTGRILNISTTSVAKHVPATVLNVFNAPNVVIWSAILASSAFPAVIEPVEFVAKDPLTGQLRPFHAHGKKWSDGTIKNDIPIAEVQKMYDAHFLIVSQVNPHIIPLLYNRKGSTGLPSPHRHGSGFRGGFILATLEKFLKLEMRKWLTLLGDLDLLPTFFGQDFRYIFLQPVTGTVTIVPAATLRDYARIIMDPTLSDMQRYITRGEQATWRTLSRVSNHYRFEALIRDSLKALELKRGVPTALSPRFAATAATVAAVAGIPVAQLPASSNATAAPADSKAQTPTLRLNTQATAPISTAAVDTASASSGAAAASPYPDPATLLAPSGGGGDDSPRRRWAEWSDCDSQLGEADRLEMERLALRNTVIDGDDDADADADAALNRPSAIRDATPTQAGGADTKHNTTAGGTPTADAGAADQPAGAQLSTRERLLAYLPTFGLSPSKQPPKAAPAAPGPGGLSAAARARLQKHRHSL